MLYFKMDLSKKYVHTIQQQAQYVLYIRHDEKHHFDMIFEKTGDVPFVCMMYSKYLCGLWDAKNEN